jgi:hypothetical protein
MVSYHAATKGDKASIQSYQECYMFTFNKHVVLDSQKRKTNHLNSMSRSSITNFAFEGKACKYAAASQQKNSQGVKIINHVLSRDEFQGLINFRPSEVNQYHLFAS